VTTCWLRDKGGYDPDHPDNQYWNRLPDVFQIDLKLVWDLKELTGPAGRHHRPHVQPAPPALQDRPGDRDLRPAAPQYGMYTG